MENSFKNDRFNKNFGLQEKSQKPATNKIYFLLSIRKPKNWIRKSEIISPKDGHLK